MKIFSIRNLFYLVLVLIFLVAVQMKKAKITEARSAKVISVLVELVEKGIPIETTEIRRGSFKTEQSITLTECPVADACFYTSRTTARRLKRGNPIRLPGSPQSIGVITQVATNANVRTGLFESQVRIDQELKEKNTIKYQPALVQTDVNFQTLSVPIETVIFKESAAYVWLLRDGEPMMQKIQPGSQSADRLVVLSGLSEGDQLITAGTSLLGSFEKVRVQQNHSDQEQNND